MESGVILLNMKALNEERIECLVRAERLNIEINRLYEKYRRVKSNEERCKSK